MNELTEENRQEYIQVINEAIAKEEYIITPGSKLDEVRQWIIDKEIDDMTEFVMSFMSHIKVPKKSIFAQPDDRNNEFIL